ncbi:MAG: hypothetical protein K8Q91_01055 [Candidatus Vogelbacteria bacterium]|nr:hypothetical protein [Candidatus Vogelbacteria bacterium]
MSSVAIALLGIGLVALFRYWDDVRKMWKSTGGPTPRTTTAGGTPVTAPKPKGPEWDPFLTGAWVAYWTVVVFATWWVFPAWFLWFVTNTGYTIIAMVVLLMAGGSYFLSYEKDAVRIGRSRFWKAALTTGLLLLILTPLANANGLGETDPKVVFQNLSLPTLPGTKVDPKRIGPLPEGAHDIAKFTVSVPATGWSKTIGETASAGEGKMKAKTGEKDLEVTLVVSHYKVTFNPHDVVMVVGNGVRPYMDAPYTDNPQAEKGVNHGINLNNLGTLKFQSTNGKETTVTVYLYKM